MFTSMGLGISIGTAEKLLRPSAVEAVADGIVQGRLHVTDKNNGIRFLVDTGADISLLPRKLINRKARQSTMQLYAANGVPIKTFGERLLTLDLGLRRSMKWAFCVAEVSTPIIGADFLYHFNIVVNLHKKSIQDNNTGMELKRQLASKSHTTVSQTRFPFLRVARRVSRIDETIATSGD